MKALQTYQEVFKSYEKGKKKALEKDMEFPFFANYTGGIDAYLKNIDRDDVIKELQSRKKGGNDVKVKNYCPLKSEGFHSLFLEKHILYRYAAYDEGGFSNVVKLYQNEFTATEDRLKMVNDVGQFIPTWTSD
jgi:hypothetical protein